MLETHWWVFSKVHMDVSPSLAVGASGVSENGDILRRLSAPKCSYLGIRSLQHCMDPMRSNTTFKW